MPPIRKVYDLTADDATALLRTIAELQEQLDEDDENLQTGLIIRGLRTRTSAAAQEA